MTLHAFRAHPHEDLAILEHEWDVVVIGAGPAGSSAACRAAQLGLRTLLVDRATFPRTKVCGGCLSHAGFDALRQLGLEKEVIRAGSPIRSLRMHARGTCGTLELAAGGVSIGREVLDSALARGAEAAGAKVAFGTSARLDHAHAAGATLALTRSTITALLHIRVVIVADGLSGSFLPREESWQPRGPKHSYMGLGTRVSATGSKDRAFPDFGEIQMHCGRRGYVGMVRLADGSVDVAAAAEPAFVHEAGGPSAAVDRVMQTSGWNGPDLVAEPWRGTPLLTRRREVEHGCIFVVGDAAGYVEPFTGEGMTWAIEGGIAAADHAARWLAGTTSEGDWRARYHEMFAASHRRCAVLARFLRSTHLVQAVLVFAGALPFFRTALGSLVAGSWNPPTPAQRTS